MEEQSFREELSKELISKISNLIDGNQATKSDVKPLKFDVESLQAKLFITWIFFGEDQEYKSAGGSYVGTKCSSLEELVAITKEIKQIACESKELRLSFVEKLKASGREAILFAVKTYCIKDFGAFSAKDICRKCKGSGKVKCSSCGGSGKIRCSKCFGSGSETRYRYNSHSNTQEAYSTSCSSCWGSGNVGCSSCSGNGKIRCDHCSGHGYFIITRHIEAKAKPSIVIKTETSLENDALEGFLRQQNIIDIYKTIYFEFQTSQSKDYDEEEFIFVGFSTVIKQDFQVKNKSYACYAYSNPPVAFIKPYIFDDLFSDEIDFLDSAIGKNKWITKRKAIEFFDKYSGQPVLDSAIKRVASERTKNNEDTAHLVEEACHGFISKESASKLSCHINKFMEKVSPAYSPFIWWIATIFLTFIGILLFEYSFELYGATGIVGSIFAYALIVVFLIFIAYPLNLLIVFIKRWHIPHEYRQQIRHMEPIRNFIKISLLIGFLVVTYGIFAHKGYFPKTNGEPLHIVLDSKERVCNYLLENNITICSNIAIEKYIPSLIKKNIANPSHKRITFVEKSYFYDNPQKSAKTKSYLEAGDKAKLLGSTEDLDGTVWHHIQYYSKRTKKLFNVWVLGSSAKVEQ